MKEYGGYLPLELKKGKEYYRCKNMIRLNSGRNAIIYAIKAGRYKKVFMPLYLCESIKETLENHMIEYEFYHIGFDLKPLKQFTNLKKEECILIVNYFGMVPQKYINKMVMEYKNIIIDNTQAFFSEPIFEAYNIYSCRKFIGVSDGAYLIGKEIKNIRLPRDYSAQRAHFMIKCIETGTDAWYEENVVNENILEKASIKSMSKLTRRILESVDYEEIKKVRNENFLYFHQRIWKVNILSIDLNEINGPMIYPLLVQKESLRELLVKKYHIFVPQWWKWILETDEANETEKTLSKYLLPIPLDQRYNLKDMKYISNIIQDII